MDRCGDEGRRMGDLAEFRGAPQDVPNAEPYAFPRLVEARDPRVSDQVESVHSERTRRPNSGSRTYPVFGPWDFCLTVLV